jgi:predicted transcriptional regulator
MSDVYPYYKTGMNGSPQKVESSQASIGQPEVSCAMRIMNCVLQFLLSRVVQEQ